MPGQERAIGTRAAKADAGKNGTGAGAEGEGTGTTPRATADDAANTEVDAKPGKRVSGDNSGMPAKAKARPTRPPTKKSTATATRDAMERRRQHQRRAVDLPAKAKSPTDWAAAHGQGRAPSRRSSAHEGDGLRGQDRAATAVRTSSPSPPSSPRAKARRAKALRRTPTSGPRTRHRRRRQERRRQRHGQGQGQDPRHGRRPSQGAVAPDQVTKNDGDAEIGKKGKGKTAARRLSPVPARRRRTSRPSSRTPRVMQAIQALAKSVQESNAAVTKSVADLSQRVDGGDRHGEEDRCGPQRDRVQRRGWRQRAPRPQGRRRTAASPAGHGLFASARVRAARAERATQIGAVSCTRRERNVQQR